jgi:hypothetical protein
MFSFVLDIPVVMATGQEYSLTMEQMDKVKKYFDDPSPYRNVWSMKKIMPPDIYAKLSCDPEEAKKLWAEAVGFKAPDVVGKVATEIKPGTYSYKDKDKLPFKELMIPEYYKRFAAQAPPHAGNFSEVKVVPTKQYYWHPRIAEATIKNAPSVKQDGQGYLVWNSYQGGFPFPKPSGPNKGIQVVYNWVKRYMGGESQFGLQRGKGFSKSLKVDFDTINEFGTARLHGRVYMEPYGWLDERAQKNGEHRSFSFKQLAPRDLFGNIVSITSYLDPNKFDLFFVYVNSLRRVRRLSATDAQDAAVGQDTIFEDFEGFNQQLTPKRFPYIFKVIAEREYLMPIVPQDGSAYFTSTGELKNLEFERRPVYVIEMTQQDKNFIYGKRIMYIDRETFIMHLVENYNQKGNLYRITENMPCFIADIGINGVELHNQRDYIDLHSFTSRVFIYPATWIQREEISLRGLAKGAAK